MNRVTPVVDVLADADRQRAGASADGPDVVERRVAEDRRHWQERRRVGPHPSAATAPGEARNYRFRSFYDRRADDERRAVSVAADTCSRTCNRPGADDQPPIGPSCDRSSSAPGREEIVVRIDDGDENSPSIHWVHIRL